MTALNADWKIISFSPALYDRSAGKKQEYTANVYSFFIYSKSNRLAYILIDFENISGTSFTQGYAAIYELPKQPEINATLSIDHVNIFSGDATGVSANVNKDSSYVYLQLKGTSVKFLNSVSSGRIVVSGMYRVKE